MKRMHGAEVSVIPIAKIATSSPPCVSYCLGMAVGGWKSQSLVSVSTRDSRCTSVPLMVKLNTGPLVYCSVGYGRPSTLLFSGTPNCTYRNIHKYVQNRYLQDFHQFFTYFYYTTLFCHHSFMLRIYVYHIWIICIQVTCYIFDIGLRIA